MEHVTLDEEMERCIAEPPITGEDLLLEILPFMQEYFIGEIAFDNNSIIYRMPNGQRIRITATAI